MIEAPAEIVGAFDQHREYRGTDHLNTVKNGIFV